MTVINTAANITILIAIAVMWILLMVALYHWIKEDV